MPIGNFFSTIGNAVAGFARSGVGQAIIGAGVERLTQRINPIKATPSQQIVIDPNMVPVGSSMIPNIGAIAGGVGRAVTQRVLPAIGNVVRRVGGSRTTRSVAVGTAGGVAAGLILDQLGNVVGVRRRYRRINPLNVKAARRAIRRIKAVRKITQEIERQLPKRKATQSCAPFGRKRKC